MLLRAFPFLALLGSALCSVGCGSDEPPDDPCNELVNDGPEVTPEIVSAGTTPMGGTIVDGIYEQTGYDQYPDPGVSSIPPDPRIFSTIVEVSSGTFQIVTSVTFSTEKETTRYTTSYSTSETELTLDYSCPRPGVVEYWDFTATDTELRLFTRVANDTGTGEAIYTKR